MAKKLFLPLSGPVLGPPTVDAMRKRLGGRASTGPGAGEIVTLLTAGGERVGAVLFARGDEVDVWIEHGIVRRMDRSRTRPAEVSLADAELHAIAADARAFAALREGDRVRYQHDSGRGEATLVEKCRYGGLLERIDGTVLGVGFRRIWSLPASTLN